MARIVMVGGGIVGLGAATLLQSDGHDVTVLERDPQPPPPADEAWEAWERRGVNQFRQLHLTLARYTQIMRAEVSGFDQAFTDAGALGWNVIDALPVALTGGRRSGDERFDLRTARRPVLEAAVATLATMHGVDVRRGVGVRGLTCSSPAAGPIHVTGVVTESGTTIDADLVVDSGGRRSSMPAWLRDLGSPGPVELVADSGFRYYGRHYRSADGTLPQLLGAPLMPLGSVSTLTLPADNGTWGVGFVTAADDRALRPLAENDRFETVLRACPLVAGWIDAEPISDVVVMANIVDRRRSYEVDGAPVATGVVPLGDASVCTNPSLGRGISIGMMHAQVLRDALRKVSTDEPLELVRQWQALTDEVVSPLVEDTLRFDQHRLAQIRGAAAGERYYTDDPGWNLGQALVSAGPSRDPSLLREGLKITHLLERGVDVLARPNVAEQAIALATADGWPGPDRRELLELVGS